MEYTISMMKPGWVERVLVAILLVIAALIVVHAPLTVWAGTVWPQYADIIKAWKELLMGIAFVLFRLSETTRELTVLMLALLNAWNTSATFTFFSRIGGICTSLLSSGKITFNDPLSGLFSSATSSCAVPPGKSKSNRGKSIFTGAPATPGTPGTTTDCPCAIDETPEIPATNIKNNNNFFIF